MTVVTAKLFLEKYFVLWNTEDGCIKVHSVIMDIPISFREVQVIVFKNDD